MFESGSVLQDDARPAVGSAVGPAPHALLVSFLESQYAPQQVIGLQTVLATFGDRSGPIDTSVGEDVLVATALAAQRLSSWAMHAQVRAATELYRRRAVPANTALNEALNEALNGHDRSQPSAQTTPQAPSPAALDADLARRSTAAEIAAVCGVTEYQLRRRLQVGWTLSTRPEAFGQLTAAFERGEVDLPKVETLTHTLDQLPHDPTIAAVIDTLLPRLPSTTMPRLRRALDAALIQLDSPGADTRAATARDHRGIDFRALPDAMGRITATLPIEGMLAAQTALSALSDAAHTPDDTRTTPQRDADTLIDTLTQA